LFVRAAAENPRHFRRFDTSPLWRASLDTTDESNVVFTGLDSANSVF
jgi:hypothetical protein